MQSSALAGVFGATLRLKILLAPHEQTCFSLYADHGGPAGPGRLHRHQAHRRHHGPGHAPSGGRARAQRRGPRHGRPRPHGEPLRRFFSVFGWQLAAGQPRTELRQQLGPAQPAGQPHAGFAAQDSGRRGRQPQRRARLERPEGGRLLRGGHGYGRPSTGPGWRR